MTQWMKAHKVLPRSPSLHRNCLLVGHAFVPFHLQGRGSCPCSSKGWCHVNAEVHGLVPCSICWCWLRTANLLTCTGMGTTILGFLTGSPDLLLTLPALMRFHLALRFWNQIFTWTSLSLSACAIWERSVRERYFLQWNSFSSSSSCSLVKAVRLLRLLPAEAPGGRGSEPGLSLPFWAADPQVFPSEKLSFSLSAELSSLSLHAASADFRSSFSSSELYSLVSPGERKQGWAFYIYTCMHAYKNVEMHV